MRASLTLIVRCRCADHRCHRHVRSMLIMPACIANIELLILLSRAKLLRHDNAGKRAHQ